MRIDEDLAFLEKYGHCIPLKNASGAPVIVSPQYQARVMTSAVAPGEDSLGWVNRSFIETAKSGSTFDNYGGEDRFWLGPEGGQFSIFFSPGEPFEFDFWSGVNELTRRRLETGRPVAALSQNIPFYW